VPVVAVNDRPLISSTRNACRQGSTEDSSTVRRAIEAVRLREIIGANFVLYNVPRVRACRALPPKFKSVHEFALLRGLSGVANRTLGNIRPNSSILVNIQSCRFPYGSLLRTLLVTAERRDEVARVERRKSVTAKGPDAPSDFE
jgi:hypothetical protein